MPHDIAKGLEIWTLQTLLNISIMLVFFALGLVIIQPYYQNLKEQLTLRVSIEWLEMLSTVLADFFFSRRSADRFFGFESGYYVRY